MRINNLIKNSVIMLFFALFMSNISISGSNICQEILGIHGSEADPECKSFIENIIKELNMQDYNIKIYKMDDRTIAKFGYKNAFVFFNNIYISQDYFKSIPNDVKRFLIGHELMHIKKNHISKNLIFNLAFITASTWAGYSISKYLDKKFKSKDQDKQNDNTILQKIKNSITTRVVIAPTTFIATSAICKMFSRYCEKEADRESALNLNSTEGGIKFFEDLENDRIYIESHLIGKKPSIFSRWTSRLFSTHPTNEERIKLLKNLTK